MANNYTQFSAGIGRITPEERSWIEAQLDVDRWEAEAPEWEAPIEDGSLSFDWSLDESSPDGDEEEGESFFWVYAEEYGAPMEVADFVRSFLARFRPGGFFILTYADTCSKPRIGEFSGGAIFVSGVGHRSMDSYDWLRDQLLQFLVKGPPADPGVDAPAAGE